MPKAKGKQGTGSQRMAPDEIDDESVQLLFPKPTYWSDTEFLMRRYGMTLEDAEGRYVLKCSITQSPCHLCRGFIESPACGHGLLSVKGLSGRAASRLLFVARSEEQQERMQQAFMSTGKLPWGSAKTYAVPEKSQGQEELVVDIYAKFPYDRPFALASTEVDNRVRMSKIEARLPFPVSPWKLWDEKRAEAACNSKNVLARRCAVEDEAWALYCTMKEPKAEDIKERLRVQYFHRVFQRTTDERVRREVLAKIGFKEQ